MRIVRICVAAGLILAAAGANWPQFRGPGATGSAGDGSLPSEWSKDKNVKWTAPLPGPGASSPITFGGRVYVTCYSGFGVDAGSPGEPSGLVRHLICLDEASGKELWKTDIHTETPEAGYQGFMTQHGYASNTPTTDGERIYVFLGTAGAFAFDMNGKELWKTSLGTGTDGWGSAASPILHEDILIVPATIEAEAVVGLKKDTGKVAWKVAVPRRSWSTPALVEVEGKTPELVVSSQGKVLGIDPKTGSELWSCVSINDYICPSVVAGKGVAYVSGARRNEMLAIRCGGQGDVSSSHVLWKQTIGANVTTPVLFNGHLYGVKENGSAYCVNAADGKTVYEGQRVGGGMPQPAQPRPPMGRGRFGGGRGGNGAYASLIAADGKLFAVLRAGGTVVLAADPAFKVLATNKIDGDASNFDGTPAISEGKLLLRSNKAVYCIGQ